jgi:H+/gluconate symporter-like permease
MRDGSWPQSMVPAMNLPALNSSIGFGSMILVTLIIGFFWVTSTFIGLSITETDQEATLLTPSYSMMLLVIWD